MTHRANYLHILNEARLNQACVAIDRALGAYGCYLVGSCIERPDYRDVDVRFVMENGQFDRLFPNVTGEESNQHNALWHLMCCLISDHLSKASALPVDFQIQRQSEANTKYKGKHRSALGLDVLPDRVADGGV